MTPVLTAKVGKNADLFADIMRLYAADKKDVLDATWGRGNFWKQIDGGFNLVTMDALTPAMVKADYRQMPFKDETFDVVVLDPPYAKRVGTSIKASIAQPYQLQSSFSPTGIKEVRSAYFDAASEAHRILRPDGILILKCQDEIESGKQRWNHVTYLDLEGYVCEDLFVMVQSTTPAMRVPYQLHARKNHSYFLVHRKVAA